MKHYEADPALEFSGLIVYSLISHLQAKETAPLLKRYGLETIDVNAWYNCNHVLALINELCNGPDASTTLVSIGLASAAQFIAGLPAEIQTLPLTKVLQMENELFNAMYRNADPGYFRVTQVDANNFVHDTHNPWPDDLVYGFVFEMVRHFRPLKTHFTVVKDAQLPGQDKGGEFLRLHIHLA